MDEGLLCGGKEGDRECEEETLAVSAAGQGRAGGTHRQLAGAGSARRGGRLEEPPLSV